MRYLAILLLLIPCLASCEIQFIAVKGNSHSNIKIEARETENVKADSIALNFKNKNIPK